MMDELISDDNYEFTIILILFIHHGNSFKERINDESLYASLPNSDCMPEVSAVLLECPKQYRGRSYQDDPDSTHERNTCEPQLMVNIRVNPTFHIEQLEKFLILDEVYDPRKRTKAKILSPYLIELSRGEPIMMYPLQFSKTVKLENVNNKECDESGQHQNIGNHITTDKYMPAEPNTDNNDSDNESSKDDHGTNEEHCQHNFNHHTTTPKCDEIMESSEPPSTTCETSTVRSTTCMPLTTRPPNKCHNNHLSPEDESLNRVMQNIQKAFGPVTKIGRNRQSGRIKQNYYKGRTGDPTDFSNIFKKPHDQFENPYSNPKSDKYPNVWNKDRFMHRSFNKKTNDKIEVNSRIGPKKRKKLFQSRIFDDLSANVGVEQPFAKRLLGNKLAQLGVITSPRAVRKTYKKEKKEKEIDDVKDSFEDEDDDVSTFSKDFDYDDLLEKKIADIEGIERDELPPRASDTDEKEYRDTEERIDAILRNRKKVNENRKRFQARRKLHPYIDEKLAKIMAAKANLKSIGSKSASRREPEDENNGQMKLQSNEKYPNHQQFDEDDDLKEDSKVDMDESDLLSSVETQDAFDEKPYKKAQFYHEPKINDGKYRRMKFFRKQKKEKSFDNNEDSINFNVGKNMREEERTHNVFKRSPNVLRRPFSLPIIAGIPLDEPAPKKPVNREDEIDDDEELYYHLNGDHYRDLQGGYWPGKYGADQDKDKEITNDVNFQRLKTHNEELYQPILYGNYLKNPALMYNYQTEKSAMKTSTSSNEDETTESFVPDFMQPSKTEFENMYKYPNAFRSMLPHAKKMYSEYMETTYRPNKYEGDLFSDKNLSIEDKMRVIDAATNVSDKIDFNEISREMDKSTLAEATAFPFPLNKPKKKHKRSFLFYDDMEMPNNVEENEGIYDHLLPVLNKGEQLIADDGVQPCATCGGKGRKPRPKTEPEQTLNEKYRNCDCRNDRNVICKCDKKKRRAQTVSDAWYSVFNMSAPLPFLTTRLRIFRKCHGVWWRIVPSITLNSLSGIFANENLSILFSSHVDIFQLEKSLQLQNNHLLVPKDDRRPTRDYNPSLVNKYLNSGDSLENLRNLHFNLEDLLAISPARLTSDALQVDMAELDKRGQRIMLPSSKSNIRNTLWNGLMDQVRPTRSSSYESNNTGIKKVMEFGLFPTSLNVLERCPNNKNQLCLNMLDDRVPAFTIKLKMPFRENSVIYYNVSRVKIAKILVDATTKDALQVAVDLVNEGMQSREFSICVCNCPTACASAAKTTVTKVLFPHIRETVKFLLPLIVETTNSKHRKFNCELIIRTVSETPQIIEEKTEILSSSLHKKLKENQTDDNVTSTVEKRFASVKPKQKIVALRKLTVDPDNRCLCLWECKCHCIPKLETMVDFRVCQELSQEEKKNAGLLQYAGDLEISETVEEVSSPPAKEHSHIHIPLPHRPHFLSFHMGYKGFLALLLLLIMLLLGLIKATLGLCIKPINKWGYDYVQPARSYKRSSRLRRFCVNTFFFIIFPFLFWCKCFTPSEEDLLVASTEWPCSHEQSPGKPRMKAGKFNKAFKFNDDDDDEEEDVILSQHFDLQSLKSKPDSRMGGGCEVPSLHGISDLDLVFDDNIFNDNDEDDDEETNTRFILNALAESRESLKRLYTDISLVKSLPVVPSAKTKLAEEFVKKLKEAQIVYRTFNQPIRDMRQIPPDFKYCIQGYFLPSTGTSYEFVTYNPLAQHRGLSTDGRGMQTLRPPLLLRPKDFSRTYADKLDVLDAGDLTEQPLSGVPCINISALASVATSMAKLASVNSRESVIDLESMSFSLPLSSKRTSTTDAVSPHSLKGQDSLQNLLSLNVQTSCTSKDFEMLDDDDVLVNEENNSEKAERVLDESKKFYSYDINTIPE